MSDPFIGTLYDPDTGLGQVAFPKEPKQKCKYCDSFVSPDEMENHIKGAHGSIYNKYHKGIKVSCVFCGKRVKNVGISSHIKNVHGI